MSEALPTFRYHPDPIATGSIRPSEAVCMCCGRERGYIYSGLMYASYRGETLLCPWCIADGSAANQYNGAFSDTRALTKAGVRPTVIEHIRQRTPGYCSWQRNRWLSHCGDACEYHGDAPMEEVHNASEETIQALLQGQREHEAHWRKALQNYHDHGRLVIYKFVCRHCELVLLGYEYS